MKSAIMVFAAGILSASAAAALVAPALAQGVAPSQIQQMPQLQPPASPQLPPQPPKTGANHAPALQQIGGYLQQIGQQLQSYGAQQKGNPQAVAMVQAMQLQVEYMRNVAAIIYRQSQASGAVAPAEKLKLQSMKQSAASAAPQIAQQKKAADQALKDQQAKLEDAAKKLEQAEKSKPAKDQGGQLVNFQIVLLKVRAQLDQIMLAEMAD
ncbi:MAG: hypothetical protein ACK4NA_07855 [Alphaproteobacteria bacterium]